MTGSRDPLEFTENDKVPVQNFNGKYLCNSLTSYKVNVDGMIMQQLLDQMRAFDPTIALHKNVIQEPQCVQVPSKQTPTVTDEAFSPGEDQPPINMSLSLRENSIQLRRDILWTGTVLENSLIRVEACSVFTSQFQSLGSLCPNTLQAT